MTRPAAKPQTIARSAEIRSKRVMTQAAKLIDPADAEAAARDLARRMADLPPAERTILRTQVMTSVHDLESLIDELQSRLNDLSGELRKAVGHGAAAQAYGRAGRRPARI